MTAKSGFRFIQDNFALNVSKKADFLGWYNQVRFFIISVFNFSFSCL
jgi:hypothetical protein